MRPKSSLVVPYLSMWARAARAISWDGAMSPAETLNCMSHGSRPPLPPTRVIEGARSNAPVGSVGAAPKGFVADRTIDAARIVAELKDKMPSLAPAIRPGVGLGPVAVLPEGLAARDAVSALTNLGYAHGEAAALWRHAADGFGAEAGV